MLKNYGVFFFLFLLFGIHSCCPKDYFSGPSITFKTTNPIYYNQEVKIYKYEGSTLKYTRNGSEFKPGRDYIRVTIEKDNASLHHYIITIGDTLRSDTISTITLEIKRSGCNEKVKRFDFLYNGKNIEGTEITLP